MSETALRAAAWLLTYALHSTLLLAAAALLARRVRGEAWRESLWKAALIGGIVTATAQTQSGYNPPAGTWRLGSSVALTAELPAEEAAAPSPANQTPAGAAPQPASIESTASTEPAPLSTPAAVSADASTDRVESSVAFSIRPLVNLAIGAWMVIAVLLIVRVAWRQGRLRRMLRGRQAVSDPAVLGMMAELRRNAGLWRPVRLTTCDATPTPLALGGGEVCVPPRFLIDLDPEQQRSALAHELAHLARRDPAWHFAIALLEAVFFFQPLNRVARLRLRESAEFLCDEWAARQTGSPLGLARCLAEVASWVAPGRPPIPAGTMAMAEGGSPLVQRVQRLTSWRGGSHQGSGIMRMGGALLLVLAVAFAAPAVASSGERQREAAVVEPREAAGTAKAAVDDEARIQTGTQDSVIRHPDPGEPLERRWAWAVEEMDSRRMTRAWVAWSVPTPAELAPAWVTSLSGSRRLAVNRRVGAAPDHTVLLFTVARDGEVEHVAGDDANLELGSEPVVWLGAARGDESFAQLRRIGDGLRDPDQRESLVEVVGLHDAAGVVPYLAAVLGRDGSNGVRREAAYALGRYHSDEALAVLQTAVERDGSKDVRREAVEAIGRMRHARSGVVLREIAASAGSGDTRRHATEALAQGGGAEDFESLRRIALTETDGTVARQAAESMGSYPAQQAAPALAQVAWTAVRQEAARQAAESLGRFPYQWTLAALDSIARTHPDRRVALQAVESLGGYRNAYVDTYLSVISARTPHPVVAEEARAQIRSHTTRRAPAQPVTERPVDPTPDS